MMKKTQPTAEQPPSSERRNSRGGLSVKVGILRATGIASDDKVIILAMSWNWLVSQGQKFHF